MKTDNSDWSDYFERTKMGEPRATTLKAIELFTQHPTEDHRFALDLGCGVGRDTFELLSKGWKVLAIDKEQKALDWINAQQIPNRELLQTRQMGFEDLDLGGLQPDLINASFTLPFCQPEHFEEMWKMIAESLNKGSRFAGHFFGDNDEWASTPREIEGKTLHHSYQEVRDLFRGFKFNYFLEEDFDGTIASGEPKHWHLFHIVATKL